jgi:hypothetical protein
MKIPEYSSIYNIIFFHKTMLKVASLTSKLPFGNKAKATGFRMAIQSKLNKLGIPQFGRFLLFPGLFVGIISMIVGALSVIPKLSDGRWYMGIYCM